MVKFQEGQTVRVVKGNYMGLTGVIGFITPCVPNVDVMTFYWIFGKKVAYPITVSKTEIEPCEQYETPEVTIDVGDVVVIDQGPKDYPYPYGIVSNVIKSIASVDVHVLGAGLKRFPIPQLTKIVDLSAEGLEKALDAVDKDIDYLVNIRDEMKETIKKNKEDKKDG